MAYFLIRHHLFDIEELAEAAYQSKLAALGILAAGINHEVKNPLFVVKGLADSYLDKTREGFYDNKEQAVAKALEMFTKVSEQAGRAMEIGRSFSLFAKEQVPVVPAAAANSLRQTVDYVLPLIRAELKIDKILSTVF